MKEGNLKVGNNKVTFGRSRAALGDIKNKAHDVAKEAIKQRNVKKEKVNEESVFYFSFYFKRLEKFVI